jgi:uncharacterized membrane protein YuzA (DUF378 family)
MPNSNLYWIALVVLIIGGLNWGLVGLFSFNLVEFLFGLTLLTRLIYILVGAAAVWVLIRAFSRPNC